MNSENAGAASKLGTLYQKIAAKLGVDGAVQWTLLTQGIRLVTGPITMLLMVHYLTPEIQGYAYTFTSVLALSIFLEMGFSQNILQFASHEYSKLEMDPSRHLSGDARAMSRLVSLGRLSFKYYGIASLAFFLILVTGGRWFFESSNSAGVSWAGPWFLACITSALSLAINPCWALIEGCNQIAEVERFRFYSSLIIFASGAVMLVAGFGLYAVVAPSLLGLLVSVVYLLVKWRRFFSAFRFPPTGEVISWKKELWPFQWRIAISWMSGYFIFSIITPIIFKTAGAAQAGRFGFTMQLVRMISTIASSWSTSKLPLLGMLVARSDWNELNRVWWKITKTTIAVATLGSAGMIISMEIAARLYPKLADRYTGMGIAAILCASMICQSFITSCAYFLRAFKSEPFMILSVLNAALSFGLVLLMGKFWGMQGAAAGYAFSIFLLAPPAYRLFSKKRREFTTVS